MSDLYTWLVESECDTLCHIEDDLRIGAFEMMKYTVTTKDNKGTVLFIEKIEGKASANKVFAEQIKNEQAYSVKMTRWVVTTGVTSIEKGWYRK